MLQKINVFKKYTIWQAKMLQNRLVETTTAEKAFSKCQTKRAKGNKKGPLH